MSDNGDLSASGGRRTGWAELTSGETVKLAGPAARLGARVLDIVILALAAFIITPIFFDGLVGVGGSFESALLGWAVLMVMTSFAYEVIQIAVWGQTLGKRVDRRPGHQRGTRRPARLGQGNRPLGRSQHRLADPHHRCAPVDPLLRQPHLGPRLPGLARQGRRHPGDQGVTPARGTPPLRARRDRMAAGDDGVRPYRRSTM